MFGLGDSNETEITEEMVKKATDTLLDCLNGRRGQDPETWARSTARQILEAALGAPQRELEDDVG